MVTLRFQLSAISKTMQTEIIISGFGGQGVLFAGQLLAYAAMDSNHQVTWIPSYGPEMRGGTAHCTVIIANEEIGSPLIRQPKAVIAMNLPSFDKYEKLVAEGGVLIVNSSLIDRHSDRADIRTIEVPANAIAEEFGNNKMANIVLIGALLTATKALPLEVLEEALRSHLPSRHQKLLEANLLALHKGAQIAEVSLAKV